MRRISIVLLWIFIVKSGAGQGRADTVHHKELQKVIIKAWQRKDIHHLDDVANGFLNIGKKSEVVILSSTNANVAVKNARQIFSKIPGVFVYDMDGSGNQLNISTRGLDPHRSWEYNIRQNGIITNSDMYGYPASHYSAPIESFERIELVRGTGSLQYGAQFGGMINYITKKPDSSKAFTFESINTAGSYGLLSTYNAISGTKGKFSYYAYYHKRHSNGYRKNSRSDAEAQFLQLNYKVNSNLMLKAEIGRSKYLYQIPGPLNDSMFRSDPTMSSRSRNYFSPDIYVPSFTAVYNVNPRTSIFLITSGVFGSRNSVQFDAFANVPDTIQSATGMYSRRQVDVDNFSSKNVEIKVLSQYQLGGVHSTLSAGTVYMNNDLQRHQLGKGTTGTDYDLTVTAEGFGRDLNFKTTNIAVYAENSIQFTSRWSVSPGIRIENGKSAMSGKINNYPANEIPNAINHHFIIVGASSKYQLNEHNTIYAGISEAYRPVIFKDIIPSSVYEKVDKNLENASGYNAELGIRGKLLGNVQYDFSLFRINYYNRLGTLVLQDDTGQSYTYKTNIGDSRSNGVELFLQYKFPVTNNLFAAVFTSTAFVDALYSKGQVSSGTTNKSIKGNRVESVPRLISRNGLDLLYKGFTGTLLYSYTSDSYSDALNTVTPPLTGARGYTPSYGILDFNVLFKTNAVLSFRAGINNVFDKQYFTKRPTFYPGPGIWPSDGRNVYVTVSLNY